MLLKTVGIVGWWMVGRDVGCPFVDVGFWNRCEGIYMKFLLLFYLFEL